MILCGKEEERTGDLPLRADLYLKQVDLSRYWPADAPVSFRECISGTGKIKACLEGCSFLSSGRLQAFKLALASDDYLPSIPLLTVPQPTDPGLVPVNEPDEDAPVLVTGNNVHTFEVLMAVWSLGITPAYFLLVDTLGNTVDMAMIYGEFRPGKLAESVSAAGLEKRVSHRRLLVPGLTSPLSEKFAEVTGWEVEVGPVCAVELPLFLGDRWRFQD
ncbi:MAG: hypothetical protein U1D67_06170 [Dehalococcoidia bacterium]|nr:hypothetical protein [Dehalococcoidia bacterium]